MGRINLWQALCKRGLTGQACRSVFVLPFASDCLVRSNNLWLTLPCCQHYTESRDREI